MLSGTSLDRTRKITKFRYSRGVARLELLPWLLERLIDEQIKKKKNTVFTKSRDIKIWRPKTRELRFKEVKLLYRAALNHHFSTLHFCSSFARSRKLCHDQ